jgi:hypothetical protein
MPTADYAAYLSDKKIQVSQTANKGTSVLKFRAPGSYVNYFPLNRGISIIPPTIKSVKFNNPNYKFYTLFDGTVPGNSPTGSTYDGADTIYIICKDNTTGNNLILAFSISTKTITPIVANTSSIRNMDCIAYDTTNSCLYIGSNSSSIIYTISNLSTTPTSSTLVTTINTPSDLAYDGVNTLYVADYVRHVIYAVNISAKTSSTFAGSYNVSGTADGAKTTTARFNSPYGIACDGTTAVYVSDRNNHSIRKIDVASGTVSTLAGTVGTPGFTDGIGTNARFRTPRGLTIDSVKKVLYITDQGNSSYRSLDLTTNLVTTVAGSGAIGYTPKVNGGYPLETKFGQFNIDCVYASPYLYIIDSAYKALHRVDVS